MKDIDILWELEEEIKMKFIESDLENVKLWRDNKKPAYACDEDGCIIGIKIASQYISQIPRKLVLLKRLRYLNLFQNKIISLRLLAEFPNLIYLNLAWNRDIRDIKEVGRLIKLQELYLFYNEIQDLSSLENLSGLRSFRFDYNEVVDISLLGKLTHLEQLNISSNQIEDLSPLTNLKNLKSLRISKNRITDISPITRLPNLEELWCYGNKIKEVPDFQFADKMLDLGVGNNELKEVDGVLQFTNLINLSLSGNQIEEIEKLFSLKNLRFLNLENNKIQFLPQTISELKLKINTEPILKQTRGVFVNNNPIELPPVPVLEQGKKAIVEFFKQRNESLRKYKKDFFLHEAKLMIIGESGAGKTTFVKRLQNASAEMPVGADTTLGVEVQKWEFPVLDDDAQLFNVNLWDFGGQAVYHGTHQFFFSDRALYVLVADTRKQDADFNYWLLAAEQLAGDSPLIILLNLKEGHRWEGFDEVGLRQRFPKLIRDVVRVNLSDSEAVSPLQKKVKLALSELPHIGDVVPFSWIEARKALSGNQEKYISFDRFREILAQFGMKTQEQIELLSRSFHNLGIITHFYDDPILQERVFLDSNWLMHTVYRLLDAEKVKEKTGVVSLVEVQSIWSDLHYETPKLIRLLQRFGLLYPIESTNNFIVPEHLPMEKPYQQWFAESVGSQLLFRYRFDKFMPRGIMSRLIVALHHLVPEHKRVWRRGVNLSYQSSHAEIVQPYGNENRFDIRIVGDERTELLALIIDRFDNILKKFPKLNYEKLVPCICPECDKSSEPHFYVYADLVRRKQKGKQTVECEKSYDDIFVTELLEGLKTKLQEVDEEKDLTKPKKAKLFISYSHKNEPFKNEFQTHLAILERLGKLEIWQDRKLLAGDGFDQEIFTALDQADIICLLISPEFILSDYCFSTEMEHALERLAEGTGKVVPIILTETALWHRFPIGKLNALPTDGKPVDQWANRNEAWSDVIRKIEKLIEAL